MQYIVVDTSGNTLGTKEPIKGIEFKNGILFCKGSGDRVLLVAPKEQIKRAVLMDDNN